MLDNFFFYFKNLRLNIKINNAIKKHDQLFNLLHKEKNYTSILNEIKKLKYDQIKQFEIQSNISNEILKDDMRLKELSIFKRCNKCNILHLKSEKHKC